MLWALTQLYTFPDSAVVAVYQAALRTLQYQNTAEEPTPGARTIAITVFDGEHTSDAQTVGVGVTVVNDRTPSLTLNDGSTTFATDFEEEGDAIMVVGNLDLTDADSGGLLIDSATVTVSNGQDGSQEQLTATAGVDIGVTYDEDTYTLHLTGPATVQQFKEALATVEYINTANEPSGADVKAIGNDGPAQRTILFVVNDGEFNSADATTDVSMVTVCGNTGACALARLGHGAGCNTRKRARTTCVHLGRSTTAVAKRSHS